MKASDLRIGNLICDRSGVVVSIASNYRNESISIIENNIEHGFYDLGLFNPIPLTEEWLVKFGFTIRDKKYSLNYGGESMRFAFLDIPKNQFILYFHGRFGFNTNEGRRSEDYRIQFVHQLQNLYFALVGEELTLIK